MASIANDVQHEAQRGLILRVLIEWKMEWVPFHEVRVQVLRRSGYMLSESDVQFHLNYLVANGYAEVKRLRAGRADLELTAARATPKAIDLLEGRIAEDPGVAF